MLDYISTLFSEPIAFFDQAIFRVMAVLIGLVAMYVGKLEGLSVKSEGKKNKKK